MIIHCPNCSYSRKPIDSAPPGQCPSCGIDFHAFLSRPSKPPLKAAPKVEPDQAPAKAPAPTRVPEQPARQARLSACTACGGTVSLAALACPHCGHPRPAPRPAAKAPTLVRKKHLAIAGGVLLLMFVGIANQRPAMSGQEAARQCAREAGLDPDSGQSVSMEHLRSIDACLTRLGFKTKP
jgi:pyruvate/2-oxoglutarate dehydrogenase complex dihydrolipoamide acyltransferase (E2) component